MFAILPWWFIMFPFFHLLAVLLLAFVVFRAFLNWTQVKTRSGFMVFLAFGGIGMFHLLSFLTFTKAMFYVVANSFLILGFVALLVVLVRVSRR
jgi:hypothetical protein